MEKFIQQTFDTLHGMPELGFCEIKTSAFLADALVQFGYTVECNVGTTGIVAYLDSGVAGESFALRADMDALPFVEDGKEIYVHACGHDANATMVLAAAKSAAERGIKTGKLYIVFQQAEERVGAVQMIETGKLDDIDSMVGIHLRPHTEAPLGYGISGLSHSATYFMKLDVKGSAAHGARPHLGVNALETAIAIVNLVNTIKEDVTVPHSVKATQMMTQGNSFNTIPDRCSVTFDLRSQTNDVADSVIEKIKCIAEQTAKANGTHIENIEINGVPAGELNDELTNMCHNAIETVLGQGKSLGRRFTIGGEDIHYFTKMKGIQLGYIGLGNELSHGLHDRNMTFKQEALPSGYAILCNVIDQKLGLK